MGAEDVGAPVVGDALVGPTVGVWVSLGLVGVLVVGLPVGDTVGVVVGAPVGAALVGAALVGLTVGV